MSQRQQANVIQPTFYDILGVDSSASDMDIKMAYRRLVLYWHPDKMTHNPSAAEYNLKVINEAYSALKTRAARSHYDQLLRLQQKAQRHSSAKRSGGKWGKFWNWLTTPESNQNE